MGIIIAQGQTIKAINLETSKGNPISNYQVFEISSFERNQFSAFTNESYPLAVFRNSPSPIYNCHGMSFASRRTNIDSSMDIRKILSDDGYLSLLQKDTLPGDLVLYVESDTGDISHSGSIISVDHTPNNISTIFVISKWGKYREVVHNLYDSPYKGCSFEFYRINHVQYEKQN